MDDERQRGRSGGSDVGAEAALLRLGRAAGVVIIQSSLAQRDDLGMPRSRDQLFCAKIKLFLCMMRVRAHGAIDARKTLGDRQHILVSPDARADGEYLRHTGSSCTR